MSKPSIPVHYAGRISQVIYRLITNICSLVQTDRLPIKKT